MKAKVVNPRGEEIGRVSYSVKAKNKTGAMTKIRRLLKANRVLKVRKNVDGFYDQWGFHPIRRGKRHLEQKYDVFRLHKGSPEKERAERKRRRRTPR